MLIQLSCLFSTESLPDEDVVMDDTDIAGTTGEAVVDTCETIVNQIRKDEFGVGVHLSEDGQRLMKVGLRSFGYKWLHYVNKREEYSNNNVS